MNKVLLEYLLKSFALIANIYPFLLYENVRDFVKSFLLKEFSESIIDKNIIIFQNYFNTYHTSLVTDKNKPDFLKVLMDDIQEIKTKISGKQKFLILIRMMLFGKFLLKFSQNRLKSVDFSTVLNGIAMQFQIDDEEYLNCSNFISGTLYNVSDKQNILIASGNKLIELNIPFLQCDNLHGQLFFYYLKSIRMIIFYYNGSDTLLYNDKTIYTEHIYEFHRGLIISGQNIQSIFYNQVLRILTSHQNTHLLLQAENIEYRFKRSNKGIHTLSLYLQEGELIGMIGRSGAGKSTLLNLLNGNLKPSKGKIFINSIDLNNDDEKLTGLIGYVPQDDLLIEELSVFKNLYINAQLCFSNLTTEQLTEKVNNLLIELNLFEARNLKVGSPLNKYISGGQRKKLNIALELIREPWILYADEPTSGLSSSDSEEIMHHLSELALSGRIVFVNVHQPSSDIFKLFDKVLVMDNDGYAAYFGNPVESISYFHAVNNSQLAITDKCNVCGNLNTESIFKALEDKKVNEFGEYSSQRKTSPEKWHELFRQFKQPLHDVKDRNLPETHLLKPKKLKQFRIFFNRNFLSKIANRTYVALALTISPLLALVLAMLCKSGIDPETKIYAFGENENISAFLFMSVIVSIFIGLIISAEEIIRDRQILVRESFLKLNKSSYIYSKVLYLVSLSAIQTIMYVVISNYILQAKGMVFIFFIILFSASCFANLLGLLISSIFKSVVVIYILVPLLIVPQILLSGVVVNFEKLNAKFSNSKFVPIVGDLMVSRWAYEALIVSQFRYNSFQSRFFEIEKRISNIQFDYLFIIPILKEDISNIENQPVSEKTNNKYQFIRKTLDELNNNNPELLMPGLAQNYNLNNWVVSVENYLNKLNNILWNSSKSLNQSKDSIIHSMCINIGSNSKYLSYKDKYFNKSLSEFLLNRQSLTPYIRTETGIIRKLEPIYQNTTSHFGRAQFLASDKRIGSFWIETPLFNVLIIWIMSFILLIALLLYSNRSYHAK